MTTKPRTRRADPCRAQRNAVERAQRAVDRTESLLAADPPEPRKRQLEKLLVQQNLALAAAQRALAACEREHRGSKKKTKKKGARKKKAKKR